MAEVDLESPELLLSRELSWLEFNDRVLREGLCAQVPLLERLKFLAIVSSNLDEFFMIRVAGLKQQLAARLRRPDDSGMSPADQMKAVHQRVGRMVQEHAQAIRQATAALAEQGLHLLELHQLSDEQRLFLTNFFANEVLPTLTSLAVGQMSPPPILPGLKLYLALLLEPAGEQPEPGGGEKFAVVPIPGGQRFITVPAEKGLHLVRLEDVVADNAKAIFPGYRVQGRLVFRFTRDADVAVDEEDAAELLQAVEQAVRERRRRAVVRLELAGKPSRRLRKWLMQWLEVNPHDVYPVEGMLDAACLMEVANRPGFDALKYPDWPPQPPRDLAGGDDLFRLLQDRDVLLAHPYDSFDPVIRLLELAAGDPSVLAIKQTLYRTSGESPIVRALVRAAESGKQVTVLVELKARFDEAKNVTWARRLEDAGCYVLYGIAGFKTHAKALLIVRREAHRIRRYAHLSTGNYNERTARLYSDIGLMTADNDMTADVAAFFNLLTGYSQAVGWTKIAIAPTGLRHRFLDLIDREVRVSTPDKPGLIMAKVNSLQDREICQALYRASRGGVRVRLNVRGICCLRPGVAGASENIEVVSVVDRFLEHARIFYFRNGGHEELYLSSADWMTRNIDRRLEILFPVQQKDPARRLVGFLQTYFADNVKAWRLRSDGLYERVSAGEPAVRSQEALYQQAVEAARAGQQAAKEFRPLARPEE